MRHKWQPKRFETPSGSVRVWQECTDCLDTTEGEEPTEKENQSFCPGYFVVREVTE